MKFKTAFLLIFLLITALLQSLHADEMPKELAMKTDVGEIVLGVNPCDIVNEHGFEYVAYATDGDYTHKGCWFKDRDIVNIWFYAEITPLVATYKDYYFKPRGK